ncbi:Ig-like domain-containing protein [Escherichia coli]
MKMIFTGKVSGEKTVLTAGGRHTVKAQPGEQYGLIDEVTGLVPDGVEADRSGDDLILRKKEEDTEVRIEGFWEECQPGETQCTAVFNIVGEDGQVTEAVLTQDGPVLDDITAGQSGTLSDDDRGGFIWLGGLAFGGGLAAMALAAGGGGSKHRHENDDSDTTAPSSPALKAEDDGSVSVVLPGDANKGDTVEITFEDEKGGKHTVTLEKGDNGWTSSDPTLIPDSNGDKVTIPADNVKDNSEVTAIAKDPSGNESDPSTVTSKTDGVADAPVLSIPEVADGYANADELKDGLQAEVTLPAGTAEGAVITLTVTRPDKTTENVTHTVTKDEVAAGKVSMDIPKDAVIDGQNSVSVSLTQGSNPAKPGNVVDFTADTQIPGDTDGDGATDATPVVAIPEAADGVNAEELKDGVQTEVTVPKGSAAGDTLTLTVTKPDGTTDTVEHTLTADEVTAGKAAVTIPADKVTADGQYSVTAEITDPAGNTSGQGQPTDFTVDTQIPGDTDGDGVVDATPVVAIPEAADGVNAEELKDGVQTEVTVPKGSAAGDTLTLTVTKPDGTTDTVEHTLTADEVTAGKADVTIPADKVTADGQYSVTAEITDPAGNTSGQGQPADFAVDTVAPSAPVLKAEDDGSVSVELPGDANKGDTVDVTFEDEKGGKHTVTLEKGDNGWTSSDPTLIPDSNGDKATIPADNVKDNSEVTAIAKDPSGNESDPSTVTSKTDGVADAPVLSIPEVADGYANADELKDGLQAEVTLPAGTAEGAVITLTVTRPDKTTENVTHTVTKDEVAAGKVSMDIPKDAVIDGQNSVSVSLTQGSNPAKPGNVVDFTADTQIPGDTDGDGATDATPVVAIPEAADGVNAEELKDGVQTEVTVPKGSAAGDTLTLTVTKPDGTTDTVEHTLTADEVTAGKADVTIPADKVTADGQYSVTAEITDPAGNTSGQGQPADFAVDTVAPSAPVLKAEDDGSVSVDLPGDANKGDTVDVTFEDEKGGKHTVTLEKGDNGWTSSDPTLIPDSNGDKATIPADNVKDNSEVTAIAKDPSGNESDPSTVTSKTDGVADAPVLSIPEVADGYANADELKDGLQAEVTLPAGTAEGAVITLTVTRPDKTTENVTHTVTKDEVAAGKVSMDIPKDAVIDGQNSVSVSLTQGSNPAKPGNVVDFTADTQIPGDTDGDGATDATPVVAIPEAADGVNAEELKDGVQTEVTVPKGSAAGDTLTLTVTKPDGTTDTVEHTLTADEVTAGKADVTIPADKVTADGQYSVTAEITDPAGNTSGQGQPADFAVDTVAPSAPVLKAEDDGSVSVDLPGDANKGDTVDVTFEDEKGGKHTVTLEKGDNGWTSSDPTLIPDSNGDKATIPADNVKDNSEVTAIAKDPSGNESDPSTVTSKTDGVADAPVLSIPEVADGYANADELKDGLQAEVTLPAGTAEGAVITLTVTRPDKTTENVTHTVTKDEVAAGKVSMDIPKDAVIDGQNSVSVSLTQGSNPAKPGNVVDFTADTQIPGDTDGDGATDATPVVAIPEAADGVNAEELKDGVQTEVTVPKGSAAGDTLTLTVTKPDGTTDTVEHTLTADEVTAGKAAVTIPADKVTADGQYSVTAEITDPAGNTSGQGQPTDFTVDTQIPGDTDGDGVVDATPVVTIPEAADGVNAEELKDGVQTEVTVPKGSAAGDTLTLTVTKPDGTTDTVEHTLTADEVTAGKAAVTIPADKVTADGQYSVTAEITDPAGNTSGQGQPADFAVDTVAPSAPVLKAEDDGSVSVELPGDANKGDTVDVTFEDEKGGKHTVTLEKGDNGWTSSDPTLIPDSTGDKATIPADNVKDNSEVTGVAKDPSGNESDPSTVTSKTDVLPTVSISVETTSTDVNGDGFTGIASVNGTVMDVPATIEDKDDSTGLVYTVSLNHVTTTDVTVTVTLGSGAGHSDAADYSDIGGAQHNGKIGLHGDTGKVTYDGATTVTIVIPAGSKSVSFIVDPTLEANQDAFNAEGMEKVVATITGTSDNVTAATDIVDNAGASATGVIYDGNAISLRNLDGDFTLKYSLSSSVAEKGDFGYTIGANSGENDPMVTTDYNDTVYVGYYQSGKETTSYSNVANSQDNGPDGTKTDGNQSITTVDLGAGDDLMVIRGNMLANTRVYTGEGNDTFTMDGMNTALRVMYAGSYIFTESGDDIVTIKRTGVTNAGQIYLGSGSDTFIQGDATDNNDTTLSGLLDLGSGTKDISNMPKEYLSVYQDGSNLSLGNDNNIDTATDVNTVTIYGSVSGEILGGYGSDNITVTKNLTGNISVGDNADTLTAGWIYGGATVSMGDGNDTVTVTDGAYNTTISLGAGDDVFDSTGATLGSAATTIDGGEGNDTIKIGTISNGNITIDAGAGDDIVVLTKDYDTKPVGNQGSINGGEGSDTLVLAGNISVNLATGKNEGIAGFEKVDMTVGSDLKAGNTAQLVKLTASDVLGMNDNSTLYISGGANDKVDLGADGAGSLGTFTATATTVKATALDGIEHTYTLYSSVSGANVYIDNNIIDANGVI